MVAWVHGIDETMRRLWPGAERTGRTSKPLRNEAVSRPAQALTVVRAWGGIRTAVRFAVDYFRCNVCVGARLCLAHEAREGCQ